MRCLGGVVGGLCLGALLLAPAAEGSFEQVGTFAEGGEGGDGLSFATGIAVNVSGAGGVAPGTVYGAAGVTNIGGKPGVYRYSASGEFLGLFANVGPKGIAVDQSTGYVYVLVGYSLGGPEHETIRVYSADGSELIAAFGDRGDSSETFEQSPAKIHATPIAGGFAVDDKGTVYVADTVSGVGQTRVMTFRPQSPGDYEHYVYAGRANDVDTFGVLATDEAGDLYSSGETKGIFEFAPGETTTPSCEFTLPGIEVRSLAVNAKSGAVFYYDDKTPTAVHQLGPCSEGEFKDPESFAATPKPNVVMALGLNPTLAWEPSRPQGVLYGAEADDPGLGYIFAPAEVHLPLIESTSVSSVTASRALLGAQVNPGGSVTRYAFQYLTQAAWEANEPTERFAGATEIPEGGAPLPALEEGLNVSVSPTGLTPDTEYRFRAIATSECDPEHPEEPCEDTGEGEAFRTLAGESAPCMGEGCTGSALPPIFEAPIVPAEGKARRSRCKRHFVRRHGRCVRRHRRHRHHRVP